MRAPPPPAPRADDSYLLRAALTGLVRRITVEEIDGIWIFPAQRRGELESIVLVATAFVSDDVARRRILTVRLTARSRGAKAGNRRGGGARRTVEESIVEQGIAPADRIDRVVAGVMRRLDEELAALPPRAVRIGGEPERWEDLLAETREPGRTENGVSPGTIAAPRPAG